MKHLRISQQQSLQFVNFGNICPFGKDLIILLLMLNHLLRRKLQLENISISFTDKANSVSSEQLDFKKLTM